MLSVHPVEFEQSVSQLHTFCRVTCNSVDAVFVGLFRTRPNSKRAGLTPVRFSSGNQSAFVKGSERTTVQIDCQALTLHLSGESSGFIRTRHNPVNTGRQTVMGSKGV